MIFFDFLLRPRITINLNSHQIKKRIVLNNAPFKWELNIPNDTNRNCQIPIHSKGTINQVKA